MVQALVRMTFGPLPWDVFLDTSHQEEALGQTGALPGEIVSLGQSVYSLAFLSEDLDEVNGEREVWKFLHRLISSTA